MQFSTTHSPAMLSNQPPIAASNPQTNSHDLPNTASITKPFCDRIVLHATLSYSDVIGLAAANGVPADKFLLQVAYDFRDGIKKSSKLGFTSPRKRISNYDAGQIGVGPEKSSAIFAIRKFSTNDSKISIRLEFNPASAGISGLEDIDLYWGGLLSEAIPLDYFLAKATVLNVHATVDVIGVHISEILLCPRGKTGSLDPKARKAGKWSQFHSIGRRLETVSQFSAGTKPKAVFTGYDKHREQLDKGKHPIHGDFSHTRFERKLRSQKIPLRDLHTLSNPFSSVGVIDLRAATPAGEEEWLLFVDSVRTRGLEHALRLVPAARRAHWRAALEDAADAIWWDRSEVWKGWPASLEAQGFATWIERATKAAKKLSGLPG